VSGHEGGGLQAVVLEKGPQVHCVGEQTRSGKTVRSVEDGVSSPAAEGRNVEATAALELGVEEAQEHRLQLLVPGHVEVDAVAVRQPVQVAPHLTAVERPGPQLGR